MPLRVATLEPAARSRARTPQEWRREVARLVAGARSTLVAGSAEGLRTGFAEAATWDDPQRAYQARRMLAEAVFDAPQHHRLPELFIATADELLGALGATPAEPVLLNYAGVLLYEVGELGGAEALFRAARRLDPELEHVEGNLAQVRDRKRAPKIPLAKPLAVRARALAVRARQVSAAAKPTEGLTVSLCMIVKDEEEMLPGCLEPIAAHVDEIVVVDTGSSDRTAEIAESFGARVIDFPWNGSFSDARNVGLDAATGDWLLYLDADEHVMPEDAPLLRQLLSHTWREGFHLVETNYTGGEESGTAVTHLALRLFRNRPEYRFEGRIHEQKTDRMPTYLPERFETTTIRVRHYGYLKSRINSREKSRRNIELLESEARERPGPFTSFNIGTEYLVLGEAAEAARHFDAAWEELTRTPTLASVGYGPMLAARTGRARRLAGRIEDARAALSTAIEQMPDHTGLHFELALCAQDAGDLDEAETLARRCLELGEAPARYGPTVGTGSHLALCLLASVSALQGRHDEAERLYRRSLDEHPEFVAPVLQLATLLLRRGVAAQDLAAELPLERPSAALLAATACLEAGYEQGAERLFRQVLDRQPGNGVARIGIAEALLAQRRYADAASEAAAAPANSPVAAAARGEVLFAHAVAGDEPALRRSLADAETAGVAPADQALYRAWADALAGAPGSAPLPLEALPTALTALEALLRVREFEAFETLHGIAARIPIPDAMRRQLIGAVYFRQGYIDSAAEEWIASADENPTAAAFVGLAQVAVARSLPEDARLLVRHALALDPTFEPALRLLAALGDRAAA